MKKILDAVLVAAMLAASVPAYAAQAAPPQEIGQSAAEAESGACEADAAEEPTA